MKFNFRKNKKGFTLVEILLVVGFIAIASIGIYVVYAKVNSAGQANTEARNLDVIRAGIKNLYGANKNYATIKNNVVNSAGITPDAMNRGTASIVNTFGGTVTVKPATIGAAGAVANNGFEIVYNDVPPDVCAKLAPTAGAQFDTLTVGTKLAKIYGDPTVKPEEIAAGCAAGGQSGGAKTGVTITFGSL